ncbi:hypothetical protein DSB67_25385 (plasmid) [Vibrio campbellii]|uniref:hypothetical protein n=1 Tax=Vibrio campbellii TaxID=680 RepID=UPI00026C4B44|nr:hypothetical protein [Vibrio campbellii]AXB34739.1 hypothetical protein DSB67_25385 [Vibrio campbellii]
MGKAMSIKSKTLLSGGFASALVFTGDYLGHYLFEKAKVDVTNIIREMARDEVYKNSETITDEITYLSKSIVNHYMYVRLYKDERVPDGVIYLDKSHLASRVLVPSINSFKVCNYKDECLTEAKLKIKRLTPDTLNDTFLPKDDINVALASENTIKSLEDMHDDNFIRVRIEFHTKEAPSVNYAKK